MARRGPLNGAIFHCLESTSYSFISMTDWLQLPLFFGLSSQPGFIYFSAVWPRGLWLSSPSWWSGLAQISVCLLRWLCGLGGRLRVFPCLSHTLLSCCQHFPCSVRQTTLLISVDVHVHVHVRERYYRRLHCCAVLWCQAEGSYVSVIRVN